MAGRQPMAPQRSLSASALHRDRVLAQDRFWRNQKRLSPEEERTLKDRWDSRHHLHFSANNKILTTQLRDYFDRPREVQSDAASWVRSREPVRPTYLLSHDRSLEDPRDRFRTRPHVATSPFRTESSHPVRRQLEDSWNSRHHVTTSACNDIYHENSREYFTRFVAPRSERVLQQRGNGITQHCYPHRHPASEFGRDDGPTHVETMIWGGEEDLPDEVLPSLPPISAADRREP